MNIQELIPKHKSDNETADKLKNYTNSEIKPMSTNEHVKYLTTEKND